MPFRKIFSEIKARLGKTSGSAADAAAGTDKLSADDNKFLQDLLAGVTAQLVHEQHMEAARGKEPVSVRLVPQVPVRSFDTAAAWLGGGAALPRGVAWPQSGGARHQLLAQIDCSRLPRDVWGGLGPREGWLAIFMDPASGEATVLHMPEAGTFAPSPPILEDCNIVGYDGRKRAEASGYTWTLPRWPVDIVPVFNGQDDPLREGRSNIRHERYALRHDFVDDRRWPFDWPTAQMMIDTALAAYEGAMPQGNAQFLQPDVLAKSAQALADAERAGISAEQLAEMRVSHDERKAMAQVRAVAMANAPAVVERLRALKAQVDRMAASQSFSADAMAPVLAELRAMTWTHKSVPPFYRDGKQLPHVQRLAEGVQVFTLPLTTHDHSAAPSWVNTYETQLLEAAKQAYLTDRSALPPALVADCEQVWRDLAAHEIGGIGHVPWGYVHDFDDETDVTLIELPSSDLIGWQFGDVYNLVITVTKADLARNDFSRPLVQVTN